MGGVDIREERDGRRAQGDFYKRPTEKTLGVGWKLSITMISCSIHPPPMGSSELLSHLISP